MMVTSLVKLLMSAFIVSLLGLISLMTWQCRFIIRAFRRQPALRQYLFIWYPLWERGNPSFVLDHSGRYDNGTVIGTTYVDDPVQIGGSMVIP
jgi:hypothetical protein